MSNIPLYFDWRQFNFSSTNILTIIIVFIFSILILLGTLLYIFQTKLIYLPQFPPGSLSEVWLPSRFGYGPGKLNKKTKIENDVKLSKKKKCDDDDCNDDDCNDDDYNDDNCNDYNCNDYNCNEDDFKWEELEIETKDGERLQAYWIKAPSTWKENKNNNETISSDDLKTELRERLVKSENENENEKGKENAPFTIIYMQANAGNIGHRLPIAKKLQETVDCNVLLLSYRGYGKSTGSPCEEGIKIDSQTALDFVWNEKLKTKEEKEKIVIYGQSIGGAISINLAHSNPLRVRFLILENTFLSIPRLIPRVVPFLHPFTFLCTQKWNSAALIPQISQRTLFLVGKIDELIPPDHMVQLHRLALRSPHRKFVTFENGTHNDTCIQPGYFEAIKEFLTATPKTPIVTVEEITDEDD